MNYYKLFYWITRADSIRDFFDTFSNWAMVFVFISVVVYAIAFVESHRDTATEDEITLAKTWRKYTAKSFWISCITMLILWTGYVFTPSKKDALLIVGGGGALTFLTTDSSAKQLPSELTGFIVSELKSAAAEAKVEWNTNEAKNKVLEEVKNMSAAELIEKMKTDSTLTNIILQK